VRVPWLADVLRTAGLDVVEEAGWHGRGVELSGVSGLIGHHTACGPSGDCPSTYILTHGRPDLAGPLAQIQLCRSGEIHVIADGKANHAGDGSWPGIKGNADTLCIEAENTGLNTEVWPAVQMDVYVRAVAAVFNYLKLPAERFCTHYEWAEPTGRKIDPRGPWAGGGDWWGGQTDINKANADAFRARVENLLGDDMTPAQEAKIDKLQKTLDDFFGINANGTARDIRAKIDANYIALYGADHPDLPAGQLKALVDGTKPDVR
jgi:hypothetical protein